MTFTALALSALLLAATPSATERMVHVRVLQRLHPRQLLLSGPERHDLEVKGSSLEADGASVEQPFAVPDGDWRVQLPGEPVRRYSGSLSLRVVDGEVAVVLALPLERYVAEVVAAETTPGTPAEALRAQAVVVRSFVLAQGPRHPDADVCDLAHCQVLRGRGIPDNHRMAARAATEATAGQVLVLGSGAVAETPFHAACGGHTADPEEVFGSGATGAAAVSDVGCPREAWETLVPLARFRAALGPMLSAPGGAQSQAVEPGALDLVTGKGGYVVRVVAPPPGGRSAGGDRVALALDRAMGWGVVRSARFTFHLQGDGVRVSGSGLGHGLGLCQAGAAWRAARGETYQAILRHYFPLASLH